MLKILEQEELLIYNEQFFSPATVTFTTTKEELEIFEQDYPQYDSILKGLLRLYEGIFNHTCSINEDKLSAFSCLKKEEVVIALVQIHSLGIIEYIAQKEKPQLHFLQNRVAASDLVINQKNILKRKDAFEKRLNAILAYAKNEHLCRSQIIGNYFNDQTIRKCGICDNCINEKSINISIDEFDKISVEIKKILSASEVKPAYLLENLRSFQKKKVMKILHFLQDENMVKVTQDGLLKTIK